MKITSAVCLALTLTCIPKRSSADAICKGAPIPIDFVPIAELASPQCPGYADDPFAKNALELAPAADGVVACFLPSYREIGPTAASLIPCERVISEGCGSRLDGLPQAVTLRTPKSCAERVPLPADYKVVCTMEAWNTSMLARQNESFASGDTQNRPLMDA